MSAFKKLHPAIQHHIQNTLGWRRLWPAQLSAIEPILAGHDCLLLPFAQGGETDAAVFSMLSRMITESWGGISALFVCPIRSLLDYYEPRLTDHLGLVGRRVGVWHGDVPTSVKREIVENPPDLLITTPEALEDMLLQRKVEPMPLLATVRTVIVEGLHAFAGDDRGWHLRATLARLSVQGRRPPQVIALCASVGNPAGLMHWLTGNSGAVCLGDLSKPEDSDVEIEHVGSTEGAAAAIAALHKGQKRLVFCDSDSRVEELVRMLRKQGVRVFASHGSLSPQVRRAAETAFVQDHDCVIVASGTLELGAALGDLDRVIQIDAPSTVSSFLQRMGRTGRRPETRRNCLFLTTRSEAFLIACALTRLWRDGHIEDITPPGAPWRVVLQQVVALLLEHGPLRAQDLLAWLEKVFPELPALQVEELLQHLRSTDVLAEQDGRLQLGKEGERHMGRRHFRGLTSIFLSSPDFLIQHGRRDIGYVTAAVLLPEESGPAVFHLAGHLWRVKAVDWRRRRATVVPAQDATSARWATRGQLPGFAVAQAARQVLADGQVGAQLGEKAQALLASEQAAHAFLGQPDASVITEDAAGTRLWTFGGLRCNLTLGRALAGQGLKSQASGEFHLTFPAGHADTLKEQLSALAPAVQAVPASLSAELTHGEQQKFGEALPPAFQQQVAAQRLLDLPTALKICATPVRKA